MKYKVRVWIEDIVVEADTATQAEDTALEMVADGTVSIYPDMAEAQKIMVDGKWIYTQEDPA